MYLWGMVSLVDCDVVSALSYLDSQLIRNISVEPKNMAGNASDFVCSIVPYCTSRGRYPPPRRPGHGDGIMVSYPKK